MFLPYLLCTNASAVEDAMIQRGQDVIPALWAGSSQSDVGTAANWLYRVMNCLVGKVQQRERERHLTRIHGSRAGFQVEVTSKLRRNRS